MRRGHPGSHTFTSPGDSRRPPVSCRHAFDSGRRQSFPAGGLSTGGLRGGRGGRTWCDACRREVASRRWAQHRGTTRVRGAAAQAGRTQCDLTLAFSPRTRSRPAAAASIGVGPGAEGEGRRGVNPAGVGSAVGFARADIRLTPPLGQHSGGFVGAVGAAMLSLPP